jgi:hypothetical protein
MAGIFISYRREDSADICGRVYDHLVARYGKAAVFKDVDSIPYGESFPDYIQTKLKECSVCLVVIGSRWLDSATAGGQRRLDDPNDFVRTEIEAALKLGLVAIPVLVYGARVPPTEALPDTLAKLTTLNAAQVRLDPDFVTDIKRLSDVIDRSVRPLVPPARNGVGFSISPQARKRLLIGVMALALVAALVEGAVARYNGPVGVMRTFFQKDFAYDVTGEYALLCPDVQAKVSESAIRASVAAKSSQYGNFDLSHMTFTLLNEDLLDATVQVGGSYTFHSFVDDSEHTFTYNGSSGNIHFIKASGLGWCLTQDIVDPAFFT